MIDPYEFHSLTLYSPARVMIEITPDDDNDLDRVCKALRIYNPGGAAATVALKTAGGSTVSITVLATSLWIENVVVTKVFATGTDGGLVIHGYTD